MVNKYFTLVAIATISILTISLSTEVFPSKFYALGDEIHIPTWEKSVAKLWAKDEITNSDFLQGIQYLLTQGIMKMPETEVGSDYPQIPPWIKIDAKLWSNGDLADTVFVQGIQYLIKTGSIKIPKTQTQNQTIVPLVNPVVWFAPLPEEEGKTFVGGKNFRPVIEGQQFRGSRDFMKLFTEDAPWKNAEQHVKVFKLYQGWVINSTDLELDQMVTYLNNHNIAIAIEAGPFEGTSTCGKGVEGFGGIQPTLNALDRVKEAGGIVRFIALDEPFFYGSLYDGPNACHWPSLKVAENVDAYIRFIKRIYPDISIGDIEPITKRSDIIPYENWLKVYQAVSGSNFPFFHLDTSWDQRGWPVVDKELEAFLSDHKIQFGIIYFGNPNDISDDEWLAHAEERMVTYEAKAGGRPDHVIFQSWNNHPNYVLPETSPHTFTHLILSYFKTRTILDIITNSSSDILHINGKLTQINGRPLEEAPIQLSIGSVNGSGTFVGSDVLPVGIAQTDKNGTFHFKLKGIKSDAILQAKYSGDDDNWPAYIEIQIL